MQKNISYSMFVKLFQSVKNLLKGRTEHVRTLWVDRLKSKQILYSELSELNLEYEILSLTYIRTRDEFSVRNENPAVAQCFEVTDNIIILLLLLRNGMKIELCRHTHQFIATDAIWSRISGSESEFVLLASIGLLQ